MQYQPVNSDDRISRPTVNYFSIRVCVTVAVLCTIVNVILTASSSTITSQHSARGFSRQDISLLRRPSQFIGFDKIERPSPPKPRQFHNYPILVATVDSAAADKAFGYDLKRVMSPAGTISFDEWHVIINQTVSTIVQFRAFDWGMETCQLGLSLPSAINNSTTAQAPLTVYRLDSSHALNPLSLSYRTHPERASQIATIELSAEPSHWQRNFTCATEEVLTFEFACSGLSLPELCRFDWWQEKRSDITPAVYMIQHATK
ncbi:uncharacterized protein EV420DRAFT_1633669 [Desarmillaria tabescens]|uniref:Ubiquitin 3 binding protein But2 C-terminal domain-containing protein n=1 Tax=Armillaria tabescens TaxID=1929756 RepID=A0AA39NP67_ARMTA|nr:uncharacterized protein EV420DRAFT_1633669 [Desarmillaria tabescens]KAK0469248.1 hypothetical protein EV420DRAFT_1633669 [Desarmillaria tabescens]